MGSMAAVRLNQPVVGMVAYGGGYTLVASDGGVFNFGTPFLGSLGSLHLNAPIVGMAPTPDGDGSWLVARDGGVLSFGDAGFMGSGAGTGKTFSGIARSDSNRRPAQQVSGRRESRWISSCLAQSRLSW